MKRTSDIVVVGSSNTDMIISLERIPRPGETLLGGEFFSAAGGKGANQAVAAARAGGTVSLVARVGSDAMGQHALAAFRREGIDVANISRDPSAASGVALIFVDKHGENAIAVACGANGRLSPSDVEAAQSIVGGARVLLMQLETPFETVSAAARLGASSGVTVILNPAPAHSLPDELLGNVSILTPNESEAESITGITITGIPAAERAAAMLLGRGVQTVILTLGAQGAVIADRQGAQQIPGFAVEVVDTTGAGDVFNGALAVALAQNQQITEAVRFANAAAAISVTRRGAQPSAPTRQQIDEFLASHGRSH